MAKRIVAQYSNRTWMQPCSLQNGSLAMTRLNLQCRNASQQEIQQYYSFKEISEQFNPYAKFVGILFSAAAVLTGVVIYATVRYSVVLLVDYDLVQFIFLNPTPSFCEEYEE
jgi:hypothetical protein